MNIAKLEPALRMLIGAPPEELEQQADEGRMPIDLSGDEPIVQVDVTFNGAMPDIEGAEILSERGDLAAVRVTLSALEALTERAEIVYITAPRGGRPLLHRTREIIGATVTDGQRIRAGAEPWDGTGVTVGVVDTDFDLRHPAFRQYPGGPTRVHMFWDRSTAPAAVRGVDTAHPSGVGIVYNRARIDEYLLGPAPAEPVLNPSSVPTDDHGTHVAGTAAGSAAPHRGIAPGASLVLVKIRGGDVGQLPGICQWVFDNAVGPCSINISLGTNSGPHDGTSALERGMDDLLRDPLSPDLSPIPGRFVAVAAGNEWLDGLHVRARVLGANRAPTQLVWISPFNNAREDRTLFMYPGLDRIRVRMISPAGGGPVETNWVTPDPGNPNQSIDEAVAGALAPVPAGPAGDKTFTFPDGTVARVAHFEDPISGDRGIEVHFRPSPAPPGGTGIIADGFWILEFQGLDDPMPGGGELHGFIRDDVPGAPANSNFARPAMAVRRFVVGPGETFEQELFVPFSVARPVSLLLEYPEYEDLEVQLRPPHHLISGGATPGQWVRHGDPVGVPVAGGGLTAPGAPGANGLPFVFGGQAVDIDHTTVAGRKRISVRITGTPPTTGLYRVGLRLVSGDRPVEVDARIVQDHVQDFEYVSFRDDPHAVAVVPVFPAACIPAGTRFQLNGGPRARFRVTVPGGARADVRLRAPDVTVGAFPFTPWVGGGNIETAVAGSLPVVGGVGARTYTVGTDARITIDYPAPPAGSDGEITIDLQHPTAGDPIRTGTWRLEFRGAGTNTAISARVETIHVDDSGTEFDFAVPLDPELDQVTIDTLRTPSGPASIPIGLTQDVAGELRMEVIYHHTSSYRVRVRPPAPDRLPYSVGPNNQVSLDPGAAAPGMGAGGVTGTLGSGSTVTIDHPDPVAFPGHRSVKITVRSPAGRTAFHPQGVWRIELEPTIVGQSTLVTARLAAEGRMARFQLVAPADPDRQQGSLSIPGSGREIMSVAAGWPDATPVVIPADFTSPGPVRSASRMRLGGAARQWQPYQKPDITAPGAGISAAFTSFAPLWEGNTFLGWANVPLPDGRSHGMRLTWPLLEDGTRRLVRDVPPAAAAGTLTEVMWDVLFPEGARGARWTVRYPAGRGFSVRVEQPGAVPGVAAPANPRRTHAVRPDGTERAVAGADVAGGTDATPHPDGPGRLYRMGDGAEVEIRQNGAGIATVRIIGATHRGAWRVFVVHDEVFGAPVPVAVESEPAPNALGWPQMGLVLNPRQIIALGPAPALGTPSVAAVPVAIPPRFIDDVSVDITYPPPGPGAYNFRVVVLVDGAGHTSSIDSNGALVAIPGAMAQQAPAPANGRRFRFPFGPNGDNHVTITHTPGHARVTLSRGTSTAFRFGVRDVEIRVVNDSTVAPPAPIPVSFDLQAGPHDAPFLRFADGPIPYAYTRFGNVAAGAPEDWGLHVPERRRTPLAVEVIYDSRDTIALQIEDPAGNRTEAVGLNNVPAAGALGATLANTAVTAAGVNFVSAGRFRAVLEHIPHPRSGGARNRVRVVLHTVDDAPLPSGDWRLRLHPTTVASDGMVEAWVEEMLFRRMSGTSMASPHIAGVGALLLQQDHTQSHVQVKRRLLSTAKPVTLTRGVALQLPNQWDPVAGWGMVDASAALLGHTGGLQHNRNGQPAAVGQTTGCPVACEDNCLLEGVRSNGNVVALRPTRDAPYNHAPIGAGASNLSGCARQASYMATRGGAPFTGGGSFLTLASPRIDRPLIRSRDQRGGLDGFQAVSWDDALSAIGERWVEQWSASGGVVVMEPRPDAGVVRALLFNRFAHHLGRLLGASNKVTKCSFTVKKPAAVSGSRVPFGSVGGSAAARGLAELFLGAPATLVGRCDLSVARNVILWGANLPANARDLLASIEARQALVGVDLKVLAVDPGVRGAPAHIRRIGIVPGSDRHLALALMLRLVGNAGHADAARQIPADPRFADGNRGIKQFLDPMGANIDDFIAHVRSEAATYLRVDAGVVTPDDALFDRCVAAGAGATARARFRSDFDALYEALLDGPTTIILGSGPARHLDGEENVQYIGALAFLTGNIGRIGGGIAFTDDRVAAFNSSGFASAHDTLVPRDNPQFGDEEKREEINVSTLAEDAPEATKVMLWFDLDPLTHLPDAAAVEGLLQRTQFNLQVTNALDDSSRYADIILPLGDTLVSYDLQTGGRSPWINLTQPIQAPTNDGPRPLARILHELLASIRTHLVDDFEDDLKPTINEAQYSRGPLLLTPTRRREFADLFNDPNRIPNLLRDRLPGDEVANIRSQLRHWYAGVHGGEPTTDTDAEVVASDAIRFFNRMQVDWVLECLLSRYSEREAISLLYSLLQRGTALDPRRFSARGLSFAPDGDARGGEAVARGLPLVDLKGANGFAPERPVYRDAVVAIDAGVTGRAGYPMRLVIAESAEHASHHIPLAAQVQGGTVEVPIVFVNPESPSLAGRFGGPLANGARVAVVGNVSYVAGQRFEVVLARAEVRADPLMAAETLWMNPGWHGLDRGGQRLVRGIHTDEGEAPASFDNLVRLEPENYSPAQNAPDRGSPPARR